MTDFTHTPRSALVAIAEKAERAVEAALDLLDGDLRGDMADLDSALLRAREAEPDKVVAELSALLRRILSAEPDKVARDEEADRLMAGRVDEDGCCTTCGRTVRPEACCPDYPAWPGPCRSCFAPPDKVEEPTQGNRIYAAAKAMASCPTQDGFTFTWDDMDEDDRKHLLILAVCGIQAYLDYAAEAGERGGGAEVKVLVCGSRDWSDKACILARLKSLPDDTIIIEGGCRGADLLARFVAEELGFRYIEFPAMWKVDGRAAGPIRNTKMLELKPDLVIAFHDDLPHSRGTSDMVRQALSAGVFVEVIHSEERGRRERDHF